MISIDPNLNIVSSQPYDFDSISLEKWHKKNFYYYQDIENLYQFLVPQWQNVLEIGSGLGYHLNCVNPQLGIGIDLNPEVVQKAQEKFPHLTFQFKNEEQLEGLPKFDYVLLTNTISYIRNIYRTLNQLKTICTSSSRVILTFHNPAWELILKLASLLEQRMPVDELNWLSYEDVENLLDLAGFEIIIHGKRMLFPRRIPVVSLLLNKVIAPLPLVNKLCLTGYVVAKPRPDHHTINETVKNMTCSVIVPARNEAGNIESCITRMPQLGKHTEIIFVEGHSKDNTWEEIKRVQALYGDRWDIKICQQKGKGKGDAVRQAFEMAMGDVLIILDSDLTVQPEDLTYFFHAVASGRCEFANGCRLIYPTSYEAMPWLNRIANRFFAWLLSYLLNAKIKDSLCGTKAISRENYQKIAANRSYFGDFDPFGDFDLLFGAAKLGLKIKDVPVRYVPRTYGSSNIQHVKEGLILLKMCLYAARKLKFS